MKTFKHVEEKTLYWLRKSLQWADKNWNEEQSLIRMIADRHHRNRRGERYGVRDSIWYATGLLMRQEQGDVARAQQIIEAVMTYQFDEPEQIYHGTFFRSPGEPHPPAENPVIWRDYDPNWREFICTVFIIQLTEFNDLLPDDLQGKMRHSIKLAAEGSFMRKVDAEYTNISLMSAFLLDYAGKMFDNAEWRDYALSQAHKIHDLFNRYKTFNEYNSPTYYGIDFYALALWRKYGLTDLYRSLGADMEAELWRDTAQFYHAGMLNICGPYDRSYGMDLTDYQAVVGLWIAAALPPETAPLPDVDNDFDHPNDYYFMPMVAMMGTMPPSDVMPHLTAFQGERLLKRTIEPNREATAWLSENLMLGAEADNLNETRTDQFHPVTIHWKTTDEAIGWIRTRNTQLIQAEVKPNEVVLSSKESVDYVFEIRIAGGAASMITSDEWSLPGLTIQLERPSTPYTVDEDGDLLVVRFTSEVPVKLTCSV